MKIRGKFVLIKEACELSEQMINHILPYLQSCAIKRLHDLQIGNLVTRQLFKDFLHLFQTPCFELQIPDT